MMYLAIQVLFWMVLAFGLGLIAGWWMKKVLWVAPTRSLNQKPSVDAGNEVALADMQDRLREKQQMINDLQAQLAEQNFEKEAVNTEIAADDLKKIHGVGKVIEAKLNKLGITKFEQVAQLSGEAKKKVSNELDAFKGRIERDNWIASAKQCHFEKYGKSI